MTAGSEPSALGERYCPLCEQTFTVGERCPDDGTRLVRLTTGAEPLVGRDLDGRYTIVEQLGAGAMGTVYRGTQHSVGREVAIKVVTPSLVAQPVLIKRFLREARLASRLAHPNAVAVLDFGQTDDGLFYLVLELVAGQTLDQLLAAEGPLPPARVVRIAAQICDALEGAHAVQIVHRDLKPANVMVLTTGRDLVKVLDFGLAKSLSPDVSTATMTNAGALLGTPAFMPPELVSGEPCDARSDLYSLGCVLYVCATGRQPFVAGSVHELIAMHATEPPAPLTGVPAPLAAVIERLLEKDPARRYQTAAATREALEAAVAGGELVETAEPTLVAGSTTVLGWSGATPAPPLVPAAPAAPAPPPASTTMPTPLLRRAATPVGEAALRVAPVLATPVGPTAVRPAAMSEEEAEVVASSPTLLAHDVPRPMTEPLARPADVAPALVMERGERSRSHLWLALAAGAVVLAVLAYLATRSHHDAPLAPTEAREPAAAEQPTPIEPPKAAVAAPPAMTAVPPPPAVRPAPTSPPAAPVQAAPVATSTSPVPSAGSALPPRAKPIRPVKVPKPTPTTAPVLRNPGFGAD